MELAGAAYAAGLSSFVVRRTIRRLERGEITVRRAVDVIENNLATGRRLHFLSLANPATARLHKEQPRMEPPACADQPE